jgi:hypothetical protein
MPGLAPLVALLFIVLVAAVVYYVIQKVNLPEPAKVALYAVLAIILLVVAYNVLMRFV